MITKFLLLQYFMLIFLPPACTNKCCEVTKYYASCVFFWCKRGKARSVPTFGTTKSVNADQRCLSLYLIKGCHLKARAWLCWVAAWLLMDLEMCKWIYTQTLANTRRLTLCKHPHKHSGFLSVYRRLYSGVWKEFWLLFWFLFIW